MSEKVTVLSLHTAFLSTKAQDKFSANAIAAVL